MHTQHKTTAAIVALIATSDSEAAANYREFLGLAKGANKAARKAVCKWIESRYLYVTRNVYVSTDTESDAVCVEYGNVTPCNRNGKPDSDMLQSLSELRKAYEVTITTRKEIARQMLVTRAALIKRGDYLERIDNVLSYLNRAPRKLHNQVVLGDNVIRR